MPLPYSDRNATGHREIRRQPPVETTSVRATARCETDGRNAHRLLRETLRMAIPKSPRKIEALWAELATAALHPLTRLNQTCSAGVQRLRSNRPSGECHHSLSIRRLLTRRRCMFGL